LQGTDDQLRAYAELVLRMGVNLAPGQNLLIDAQIEHAAFVRVLAEAGYRLGARYVDIWYWEPHGKRARAIYAPEESLDWMPPWLNARYEQLVEDGAALVSVRGDAEPDLFNGLDPVRVGRDLMPAIPARISAQQSSLVTWTIVGFPTPGWAELVFGTPDVDRLQSLLYGFMRLDQPDPVAAWHERIDALKQRAAALNTFQFDSMLLKGPGTDLTVGLLPLSRWGVADLMTRSGRRFLPNMPTEEVYTTPDPLRVNGVVACTRPLVLDGIVIRDLRLEIVDGRVVTVEASSGADVVRQHQATDDGASFLGEIALVDGSSPIGQSGLTYFTTLLDENAACHLAWGSGIPTGIQGGAGMSGDELRAAGVNRSSVHVDFMVGAPDVEVLGVRANGETISVLRNLEWQIE
jgi:aminopeptidase